MREILWLPELTPLEETPPYVRGVLNFRGKIVPVLDLNLRFGRSAERCELHDSVIMLQREGALLGVIVNAVENVRTILPEEVEPAPAYQRSGELRTRFLDGLAKVDDQVVMLLDLDSVVTLPDLAGELPEGGDLELPEDERAFAPEATDTERAIFRERALSLARRADETDTAGQVPMAVTRFDDEYFGVELDVVREFSALKSLTRVPCSPGHILGLVNLRGEILTLLDVRSSLQLQPKGELEGSQVMVVQTEEHRVGIPVDEVLDVVYLGPAEVAAVPAAIETPGRQYLKGMAPYRARMLGILDLRRILANDGLVVNEEI